MMDVTSLCILLGFILLIACSSVNAKECYVCSGAFPERECELWPSRVRHGPGKQECGGRYCTSYIRYRPMQHLLIPLGPNKPKATASPLLPEHFEAVSINRDCVDRVDHARDNRCFPDSDGLGATCFTSCSTALCNKDLRRPNMTELHPRGIVLTSRHPTGPNEFDRWTPPPPPTTAPPPTRATTTTVKVVIKEPEMEPEEPKVEEEEDGKGGKRGRRPGKGGIGGGFGGLGEEAEPEGSGAGWRCACLSLMAACVALVRGLGI